MYMTKPDDASQTFGRQALIAAAFLAFCLRFFCYFVVIIALGLAPALMLPFLEPTSGILFFTLS